MKKLILGLLLVVSNSSFAEEIASNNITLKVYDATELENVDVINEAVLIYLTSGEMLTTCYGKSLAGKFQTKLHIWTQAITAESKGKKIGFQYMSGAETRKCTKVHIMD